MPRNYRNGTNNPNRRARRTISVERKNEALMVEHLHQISDAVETNRYGTMPVVPDVSRLRLKRDKVHTFARSMEYPSISGEGTLDRFGTISFSLSQTQNSTDFTALFDEYRIAQVTVQFVPLVTTPFALYTVLDYDDANVPTSLATIYQYETLRIARSGTECERTLTPAVSISMFNSATTSGYGIKRLQWIDAASDAVPHYGVKYAVPAVSGQSVTPIYRVIVNFIVQCRTPR